MGGVLQCVGAVIFKFVVTLLSRARRASLAYVRASKPNGKLLILRPLRALDALHEWWNVSTKSAIVYFMRCSLELVERPPASHLASSSFRLFYKRAPCGNTRKLTIF
mmetsp:Transcript_24478/g.60986  ORF Transcript_24478/g.60986 Transcript_24478/m.60986 type:complete len:107 (+) Transcript_24478:324-644(+)